MAFLRMLLHEKEQSFLVYVEHLRISLDSVNAEPLCPSKTDRVVICRTSKTGTRSSSTPAFQDRAAI